MFFGQRRQRNRRRPDRAAPLPEPDDPWDFSDDDEDDPDDDDGELAAAAEQFFARTGVRLHHRVAADDDDGEPADKGPVEPRLALRALPTLRETVLVYPEAVRGRLLQHLALYGRFQMRGKPFLGCAIAKRRRVHLAVRRRTPMASLQGTLHHEIAHLIELHPDFPERRWVGLCRAPYSGQGHRDPEGRAAGPELWSAGFMTRYASKNRHEDFAELAEAAFTRPQRVRQIAREHDALKDKLLLMAEVYERFAPGIDLPWMRRG